MIRSAVRWLRAVLPPGWALALFLVFYGSIEALYLWIVSLQIPEAAEDFERIRAGLLATGAGLYAAFRLAAFHPLLRKNYRDWLALTPWTAAKPLPLGPIDLVPQDAVIVGFLLVLLHQWSLFTLWIPAAFLFAYLFAAALTLAVTGSRWTAYGLLLGLGLAVRLSADPRLAMAVLVPLYVLAYLGLAGSLARFPWALPPWWEESAADFSRQALRDRQAVRGKRRLGWPFDQLGPRLPRASIGIVDAAAVSVLAGWWSYAILSIAPDARALVPGLGWLCVVTRLVIYVPAHWPPIGVWGRIRTGRWLIPRYDKVFAAPLLAACSFSVVPIALVRAGLPLRVALGLGTALGIWCTLGLGPSLVRWHLTGAHRTVPDFFNQGECIRL